MRSNKYARHFLAFWAVGNHFVGTRNRISIGFM
jgi:hypothetical protein